MVVERQAEYPPTFDFRYMDGERLRTDDIGEFRRALERLLTTERPEEPKCPGTFLLLRKEAGLHNKLQAFLRISNRLVKNGFKDTWNWRLGDKRDPVIWWTDILAFDVVGLPAYSNYKGRSFMIKNDSYTYRLFTRPSYVSQTVEQKK